ncbi:MAG TPA: OmpA family protein [Sphingomicrobium sp.]|nr:OmpA family protein [Sphingomicrobium sp.]
MRRFVILATAAIFAASASAQLPGLRRRPPVPPAPVLVGIDALRADFVAQAGSDKVYFGGDAAVLTAPAQATLGAQAVWLRRHPGVVVRIEGHGDQSDTREHALAVGARRAEEVRSHLVLLGVPAEQLTTMSWGKERPAVLGTSPEALALNRRAVTVLVR